MSYSDIENQHRIKFIDNIIEYGLAYGDWCVTEKIHGSNFSFWVNNNTIKCAKRSGWIEDSEKNFYGHREILEEYNKSLCVLFHLLGEFYKISDKTLEYTLYGEIFGGVYPHPDVPRNNQATKVQKGVYYTPDNDFYAFDLKVNGSYVNYKIFEEIMEASGFLWAKSLYIGDMKSCMAYPNDFQTKLPEYFKLPAIENNICEGVVIKPLDARFFPTKDRVILKNKNERFKEVHDGKAKEKINRAAIDVIQMSNENIILVEAAADYVTVNRLNNVLSKIGPITDKDFGKLSGLFTQDVIKDFKKDKEDKFVDMDKEQLKLVQNYIKGLCIEFTRVNFLNAIDGTL